MAMLSMTAPGIGLSPQGAAYGLKRKLGQLGHSEHVAIKFDKIWSGIVIVRYLSDDTN